MTTKQNLVTGKGETFGLNITYKDSTGTPVDLTGHSVSLVVKNISTDAEICVSEAAVDNAGHIAINVHAMLTDAWPEGKATYRVEHLSPSDEIKWLVYGALTIVDGSRV